MMKKFSKKQITLIIISVFILVGGIIIERAYSEKRYKENLIETSKMMINTAIDSEKLTNNYISLWNGYIKYNYSGEWTRKYIARWIGIDINNFLNNTTPFKYSDRALSFDDVLQCYKQFNDNTGINKNLTDNMNKIQKNITNLNNPSSKFKASYNSLVKMYTDLNSFEDLAVNPSGSLVSYKNDTGSLDKQIVSDYNLFKTQLPN